MSDQDRLLQEIDAFLARHNMAAATFGKKVMNDGKFVERLRDGGGCTIRTSERVRKFMQEYPPVKAASTNPDPLRPTGT